MRFSSLLSKVHSGRSARVERGDLNVLFAFVFICLVAFLAFGLDITLVLSKKTMEDSVLQNVREQSADTSMSLVAKNSSDPDGIIARGIAQAVRDTGFSGSVAVYFYEVPKASIPAEKRDTERLYAYQVVVDDPVSPVFASLFGVDEVHVPSTFVITSRPYSQIEVWRPTTPKSTVWKLLPNAPAGNMSSTSMSLADMPGEIQNAVAKLLAS